MLRDASQRFTSSVCPDPAGGNPALMRALTIALGVLLATPAAAAAGDAPLGAPGTLRVSRAADERAHPRARTEAWELQAVDPRTQRAVLIRLRHAESFPTAVVTVPDPAGFQRRLEPDLMFSAGGARGARFTGPRGSAAGAGPGPRPALHWPPRRGDGDVAGPPHHARAAGSRGQRSAHAERTPRPARRRLEPGRGAALPGAARRARHGRLQRAGRRRPRQRPAPCARPHPAPHRLARVVRTHLGRVLV